MNSHNTYSLIFPNRNANNLLIDETQQKAMMQITITVTIKKLKVQITYNYIYYP